ncbi:MAG: hypothetical protein KKG59_01830, partial [Nanoarchaeota archaeon]|nr:hypothetical protein [Nanoarchaeota archaeon]MBU1975124.1 hypothetical protein [Nanoarchaeota archaeon]
MGEKLLVCGAGQGGHAISAYAALQGHDVTLYTHSPHKADIIQEAGKKITVSGIFSGEAQLVDVTTMLDTAVSANQNIIIVTDATAHQYYAEQMAPILTDQNIVLISPGIGGALDFLRRVNHLNPDAEITVSETDTLMYACKVPSIGQSYVKVEKSNILYTTVPEDRDIGNIVKSLYPQFTNSGNSLMGLDDSPVFHIVGM